MRLPRNVGKTLLAFWLIATGLFSLLHVATPSLSVVLHVIAVAAGALLFYDR